MAFMLFVLGCSDDFTDPNDTKFANNEDVNANIDADTPASAQPVINDRSSTWELVWSDEFSGDFIDSEKWERNHSDKTRNPRWEKGIHDWRWEPKYANLNGNGELVLSATKTGANTMRCGSIFSYKKHEFKYGYFEARIEVTETTKALLTAFWMTSYGQRLIDGTGNDGAEVDVFESTWEGDFTKAVVHIDGYGDAHQANTKRYETPGIHEGYHTYGLHWTEDKMDIYYDGVKKVTYQGIWVPHVPQFLWLSIVASFGDGDFVNQPEGHLSDAKVDYVRVWKEKE